MRCALGMHASILCPGMSWVGAHVLLAIGQRVGRGLADALVLVVWPMTLRCWAGAYVVCAEERVTMCMEEGLLTCCFWVTVVLQLPESLSRKHTESMVFRERVGQRGRTRGHMLYVGGRRVLRSVGPTCNLRESLRGRFDSRGELMAASACGRWWIWLVR